MSADQLKSAQFRREREASWRDLEAIIEKVQSRGFRRLSGEELQRLPGLYWGAVSSLSVARAISLDRAQLNYLEGLVSRAYIIVYTEKRPVKDLVLGFFAHRFPSAVFHLRRHVLMSALMLALGVVCGMWLTLADESRYMSFVGPEMAQGRTPQASDEYLRDILYSGPEEQEGLSLFASMLFTHNSKVGIFCFCLGIVAGAPVAILLFANGLTLGAMTALYHERGMGWEFLAWVAGHGVTELGAVALCGGAGFAIAQGMLFPRERSRADALAAAGRITAPIVIGSICMFFIAGLLEGYFRQLVTYVPARWGVASVSALFWGWYFFFHGARKKGGSMNSTQSSNLFPITTPEGISIEFSSSTAGDRMAAFLLDLLIIALLIFALGLLFIALVSVIELEVGTVALALTQVAVFLVFNFYFIISEMTYSGTTVGKRRMGLRVIARDGGQLTGEMIVARNLTRDLEIYLPINVLMAPEALFGQEAGLGVAASFVWLLVLLLFPLFNSRRLRLGDLIGGTIVVDQPTADLLPDLATTGSQVPSSGEIARGRFEFDRQHLEHYGIHELQFLEDIFHKHSRGEAPPELLGEIARRIQRRIGWKASQEPGQDEEFLQSFYTAQRAHLEKKLLLGQRKERKSNRQE